jgi:ABC-2 type transport system ATP-binding protein
VTIILTTHYIEEAEGMADRVGVISGGRLLLVEDKAELMRKLGRKQLVLQLQEPLQQLPASLRRFELELSASGHDLTYTYDSQGSRSGSSAGPKTGAGTGASAGTNNGFSAGTHTGIVDLLAALAAAGIAFKDLRTHQSSLEDIFVSLVHAPPPSAALHNAHPPELTP